MHPRQSIIELFSTFLQFEADRVSRWATDARLRRSMQSCWERSPTEMSENFWALYWCKVWQSENKGLAQAHLTAYLQEPCYWAAQKTTVSFASTQYTVSDCFQLAIVRIDKVFKGFNLKQGVALRNYASTIFSSVIRENLRQRHEVDICTPWALLRKLSQKRLVESLRLCGLSAATINSYILAWNCFKTIYVPTQATSTRKLTKPDDATWEAIAALYNAHRHQQLHPPGPECQPDILEKWLLICVRAARSYLYPAFTSINTPTPGQESGELLDILPGEGPESLLAEIITQEEQQNRAAQQTRINTVLVDAIAQFEPPVQQLLQLYYSQELTQQQMATQLEVKQYTVSRRLTKARESLLLTLAQWSRDTMHIPLSSDVLKDTSIVLEEWLQNYYSHPNPLSLK